MVKNLLNSLSALLLCELRRQHWIGSLNLTSQLFVTCHVGMKLLRTQFPDTYRGLFQKAALLGSLESLKKPNLELLFVH